MNCDDAAAIVCSVSPYLTFQFAVISRYDFGSEVKRIFVIKVEKFEQPCTENSCQVFLGLNF